MKFFFFLLLTLVAVSTSSAAPKIEGVTNNGDWTSPSTWDLNRVPQSLDTIIIPANRLIIVNSTQDLGNVIIVVYGTLGFSNARLSLGENTSIVVMQGGTIKGVTGSDRIIIGSNEIFRGTGTSVTGPSYASSSTNGFSPFNLPVKFLGFSVTPSNNTVLVQWSTAEEMGAGVFEIERSLDGTTWKQIGTVDAAGTTNIQTNYTFTDRNMIAPLAYYRIRQIDANGRFVFTPVKIAKTGLASDIKITAIQGNVVLQFSKKATQPLNVRFVTMGGQVIAQHTITNALGQIILPVSSQVNGSIVVAIADATNLQIAKQVVL